MRSRRVVSRKKPRPTEIRSVASLRFEHADGRRAKRRFSSSVVARWWTRISRERRTGLGVEVVGVIREIWVR